MLIVETIIGSVGAAVILALVFGSFLALLPLLVGGASVLGTFLIVGGLTEITGISQIVEFVIALVGLGRMGKNHMRVLRATPGLDLVAVVDPRVHPPADLGGARFLAHTSEL